MGASSQTEASNKMEKFFIRGINWHPLPLPQGWQLVGIVQNTSLRGSIYVPAPGNLAKVFIDSLFSVRVLLSI